MSEKERVRKFQRIFALYVLHAMTAAIECSIKILELCGTRKEDRK